MDSQTNTYYAIISVIKKGDQEKIYPIVVDDREEATSKFEKLKAQDYEFLFETTGNISGATVYPFLFVEKTHISASKMITSDEGVSSLSSNMIPVDYVSEVFYKKQHPELELSDNINKIILSAESGFEEKQTAGF